MSLDVKCLHSCFKSHTLRCSFGPSSLRLLLFTSFYAFVRSFIRSFAQLPSYICACVCVPVHSSLSLFSPREFVSVCIFMHGLAHVPCSAFVSVLCTYNTTLSISSNSAKKRINLIVKQNFTKKEKRHYHPLILAILVILIKRIGRHILYLSNIKCKLMDTICTNTIDGDVLYV